MEALYEILYWSWSKASHGQDIVQGKLSAAVKDGSGKSNALIEGIRSPRNAQQVKSYCLNIGVPLYKMYVAHRIPEKQNEFNKLVFVHPDYFSKTNFRRINSYD